MAVDTMESVAVVAVPFPAQGHLNQLLHLSLLLASRGLSVHYAAPPPHVRQARARVHGWDPRALGSIEFHDLDRLSATHRRVAVVFDRLNPFAATEAARLGNGEAFGLQCVAISYDLGWLDPGHQLISDYGLRQPPASVLYVSFGTTSCLHAEQVAELAAALKGSKQRFIWVLRDADRADIYADESGESRHAKFLSEFTKETEGTGLVITGWAPQLEILAHGATAAFMSHCGWNSTMESLSHGKPVLAWPMHSDQPWDSGCCASTSRRGSW
ncbi:unnamed protein product [Miscanthus lutarioriparius]|uniref:Glycosyltransferase N-terminal domain-containing protein n=1 Tax=Miscanthus lutarioriparius TaxID=422564 RepID=A0A811QZR7_9POAL|nr:unnamed protein product [Miscanthus lutarioriparius]